MSQPANFSELTAAHIQRVAVDIKDFFKKGLIRVPRKQFD
jgi:hypothetical protein